MPEVPAIGAIADPGQGTDGEKRRAHVLGRRACRHQQAGAADREQCLPRREARLPVDREAGEAHSRKPARPRPGRGERRHAPKQREDEREERSGTELPGAGRSAVEPEAIREGHGGRRLRQRLDCELEGGCGERRERDQRRQSRCASEESRATEEPGAQKERRDDDVELLLDGERPGVEERVERRAGAEVALRERAQVDVGAEGRREEARQRGDVHRPDGRRQRPEGGDDDDHRREGGQQPPHAARVEAREAQPPLALELGDERARDHEAGDREEHVHAREAAREGQPRVEEDDERNCDPAQPLDIGSLRAGRRPPRTDCHRRH